MNCIYINTKKIKGICAFECTIIIDVKLKNYNLVKVTDKITYIRLKKNNFSIGAESLTIKEIKKQADEKQVIRNMYKHANSYSPN